MMCLTDNNADAPICIANTETEAPIDIDSSGYVVLETFEDGGDKTEETS